MKFFSGPKIAKEDTDKSRYRKVVPGHLYYLDISVWFSRTFIHALGMNRALLAPSTFENPTCNNN